MSELDYEAENATLEDKNPVLNSNELLKATSENPNDETPKNTITLKLPANDNNFNSGNDPKVNNTSPGSVTNNVEMNLSSEDLSHNVEDELEEGEIAEAPEVTNPAICHHFQIGKCHFGENCRFLHIGHSAYKMFDHSKPITVVPPPAPYPLQLFPPPPPLSAAWEYGVEEAKTLLQKARYKREADVDFEEKQLYLDFVEDQTERLKINFHIHRPKKCVKSLKLSDKTPKVIDHDYSRKKSSKNFINYFSSKKLCSMSWVKKKSRKRDRSRTLSLSNSRRRRSCSRCSACSSNSNKRSSRSRTKNRAPKIMSKLERAFSRTFRKSRSRRRSISSSLSPYRSTKRLSSRSYSSSSSTLSSGHSESYSCKDLSSNYRSKSVESVIPKLTETVSPVKEDIHINCDCHSKSPSTVKASELKNSDFETTSSNMTVSSITCTSISDISDDSFLPDSPAKSVKDPVSLVNSFDTREKYTFLVDKKEKTLGSTTKENAKKAHTSDEVNLTNYANYCKQGKTSPISFKIERKRFSNIKNIGQPFSRQIFPPLKPKIWPGGKFTGKRNGRKKLSNTKKCEQPISSMKPKQWPSRFEKVSDRKKLEKPKSIPETDQSVPNETSRSSVESYQPRKKRKITAFELELLKYVPNRDRDSDSQSTLSLPVKKIISNQIKPKPEPVTEPVKLSNVKSELSYSSKPGSLSRREQLIEQLKAIEEAIARKKTN